MTTNRALYIMTCVRAGMTEEEALISMMEYYFSPRLQEDEVDLGVDPMLDAWERHLRGEVTTD